MPDGPYIDPKTGMGGRVNLDYDGERKQFYATVDQADRSAVVQRFRQIEAKARFAP